MRTQVIYDMPESEYHELPYLSATQLKRAATGSLADLRRYLDGQDVGTKAQRDGWLAHMRVNSPLDWARVAYPDEDALCEGIKTADGKESLKPKQTAEYKRRLQQWDWEHAGAIRVTHDEFLQAERLAAALTESPCYHECSSYEVVVLFDFMGAQAKCRIDGEYEQDGVFDLYDWKFMQGTRDFQHVLMRYGYHMQAAFYLHGYQQAGRQTGKFYLVGIDKQTADPNYTVCAPLSQDLLDLGLRECQHWYGRIVEAQQTGIWPGAESPAEWTIPAWYRSAVDLQAPVAWTP